MGRLYKRGECDYFDLDGVNITLLKELGRSPAHYLHRMVTARKETLALELGSATHIATLEPERFLREYAMWESKGDDGKTRQRRGKVWDEFRANNAGKKIIRDAEYETAITIRDAVRDDDLAMKYLARGRPEVAMSWGDEETGIGCKGRVDWVCEVDGGPCIVDLKTTRDAGRWFSRDVAKLSYHLQLAFYHDGYAAATGRPPRVVIVAVESAPPHDVVTYIVPDEVLDVGRDEYRKLLVKLRECLERDEWPGHGDGAEKVLALPAWAMPDDEDDAFASIGIKDSRYGEETAVL